MNREDRRGFTPRQPERRSDPRYSVDQDSVLLFLGFGKPVAARMVDLSQDGCRVRTMERVAARPESPVEIFLRVNGVAFRLNGVLQWNHGGHLLGIRFANMVPRRAVELANVICEMQASVAARAETVNQLVAEQETRETDRRGAKERTPEPDRAPVAAAARRNSAPDEPGPQATQAPARRDRRRQPRHEVDTPAAVFLVKIGSTLRGRILDLSLSGCRIRTDERFPVGIYTRVEAEFCLEGLPLRLGGVIQVIHDRNTVGIRFIDLSDRKRQQVVELIGEIEQLRAAQNSSEPVAAEGRA